MSKKINKEDVQKKWKPFLDNMNISEDKKGWLLQYAEKHQIDNDLMERCIFGPMPTSSQQTNSGITNTLPPLLPIARRVHAQTVMKIQKEYKEETELLNLNAFSIKNLSEKWSVEVKKLR